VPSRVQPRILYDLSSGESNSDDSRGASKKRQKKKSKKKANKLLSKSKLDDKKSVEKRERHKHDKKRGNGKKKASTPDKSKETKQRKPEDDNEDGYMSPEDGVDESDAKSIVSSEPPDISDESESENSKAAFMKGVRSHKSSHYKKKKWSAHIIKRPVISSDLKWDNRRTSFPELKNRLQVHIIHAGMNYIIKPEFVRRFKKHGPQVLNYYKSILDISKMQFQNDLDVETPKTI
jgi:hypothetical protein